jgi:hypothetical protein
LKKQWLPLESVTNHYKRGPVKRMSVLWLRHQHQSSLAKSLSLVDFEFALPIP